MVALHHVLSVFCLLVVAAAFHVQPHKSISQPRISTALASKAFRDISKPAYVSEQQQFNFTYSDPAVRRKTADERHENYKGPPIKILLLGKPCSGKGTIAPMLGRAYRTVCVSTGNLLRAEVKAESDLGAIAEEQMKKGKLLPSKLLISLIRTRLAHRDCLQNGWLLDGFPRNREQALMLVNEGLAPDCIVVLDRSDELVREFTLGRMSDSATGITYHPKFHPPPPDVAHRLVWRTDDTAEAIETRLKQYHATIADTLGVYEQTGLPIAYVNSARSDLETFAEVCDFVESVAAKKLSAMGEGALSALAEQVDSRLTDVAAAKDSSKTGVTNGSSTSSSSSKVAERTLLAAVRRCNVHDMREYLPVYIEDNQVGFANTAVVRELRSLAAGDGSAVDIKEHHTPRYTGSAVMLAPYCNTAEERTRTLEGLVHALVTAGIVPKASIRNELQDVRCMSRMSLHESALAKMERAAMIYFGVPSHGVHVNGYTTAAGCTTATSRPPVSNGECNGNSNGARNGESNGQSNDSSSSDAPVQDKDTADTDDSSDSSSGSSSSSSSAAQKRPHSVWIGVRSVSKATYPGLLDQLVAGGLSAGSSLKDNVARECVEEASVPPSLVARLSPAGQVSYRYGTRKGLSTKILTVYDLELPEDFLPFNGDGEVEEFILMPIEEALDSIRNSLYKWKPNCALVMIDFALRHGFIDPDDSDYLELSHSLRTGWTP